MIHDVIKSLQLDNISLDIVPMADGGEYSSDVLFKASNCKRIFVKNIVNPYGKKIETHYLELDKNNTFIGSSEILGLSPEEEKYKNPLKLTSFGLGQLILHAINKGYKNIFLGLGGTSTVDGGIGMVQALGGIFFKSRSLKNNPSKYLTGNDLSKIRGINLNEIKDKTKNVKLTAVCDASISIKEMYIPTNQKISSYFDDKRKNIISNLENSLKNYYQIIMKTLSITNKWYNKDLINCKYLGVAGAINIGLLAVFNHRIILGSSYFSNLLDLEKKIQEADLVLTGEGKFDNTLEGKTPVGVSRLSKKYNKPVLLLCGTTSSSLKKYFKSYVSNKLPLKIVNNGIQTIISCHPHYDNVTLPDKYSDRIELFIKNNPKIFRQGLELFFQKNK